MTHIDVAVLMETTLTVQIDGTLYWSFYSGLRNEAKKRGLPLDSEKTVAALLHERPSVLNFQLHLRPMIQQVVGCNSGAFSFSLAPEHQRALRPGGGSFSPNVYLATGSIRHLSKKHLTRSDLDDEPGLNIILDCGLPIVLDAFRQGGNSGAPSIQRQDVKEDAWIAAVGYLSAWPSGSTDEYTVRCRVLRPSIFDFDPASETFGTFVPWSFAKRAPADADVFSVPVMLLSLEVLSKTDE